MRYHRHHIDWNHENNDPSNIIYLHPKVHVVVHQYGYLDREHLLRLNALAELAEAEKKIIDELELLLHTPECSN